MILWPVRFDRDHRARRGVNWFVLRCRDASRYAPVTDKHAGTTDQLADEGGDSVLFRRRFSLFEMRTPFSVKGRIRWERDTMIAEGRLPVGPVAFVAIWELAWTAGCVLMAIHDGRWRALWALAVVAGVGA